MGRLPLSNRSKRRWEDLEPIDIDIDLEAGRQGARPTPRSTNGFSLRSRQWGLFTMMLNYADPGSAGEVSASAQDHAGSAQRLVGRWRSSSVGCRWTTSAATTRTVR